MSGIGLTKDQPSSIAKLSQDTIHKLTHVGEGKTQGKEVNDLIMSDPTPARASNQSASLANEKYTGAGQLFKHATYPGTGATNTENYHYNQAVEITAKRLFKTSGQGGWDDKGNIDKDVKKQVETAFDNALTAVKQLEPSATWKNVYSVQSFHVDLDSTFEIVVETMKKLMPDHKPIWTCVQIGKLGIEGMAIEVVIEAAA